MSEKDQDLNDDIEDLFEDETENGAADETAGIGHNSGDAPTRGPGGEVAAQLRGYIERVERLAEEKDELARDIREVFAEAKAVGFDTKAMRQIIKFRKMDANERAEQEAILATYMIAMGMVPADEE